MRAAGRTNIVPDPGPTRGLRRLNTVRWRPERLRRPQRVKFARLGRLVIVLRAGDRGSPQESARYVTTLRGLEKTVLRHEAPFRKPGRIESPGPRTQCAPAYFELGACSMPRLSLWGS